MPAEFHLSACADEAAGTPEDQVRFLLRHGIHRMDVRWIRGKPALELTDDEALAIRDTCAELDVSLNILYGDACLSYVDTPMDDDLVRLGRLLELAALMQVRYVRVYSFLPPNQEKPANHLFAAMRRMKPVVEMAESAGIMLIVENEKGTVGEIPSNIHSILHAANSPFLRLAWNPANFVRAGVAQQVQDFWLMMGRFADCVILQDALLYDGALCLPGDGDGQLRELLVTLREQPEPRSIAVLPAGDAELSGEDRLSAALFMARRLLAFARIRI